MSAKESIEGFWFCIKLASVFFAILGFVVGREVGDFGWRRRCRQCSQTEGKGKTLLLRGKPF
ncbi:MAG: hypothetical protein K6U11_09570 [bacterium]|nr:hypothetical protein [bacterium]